jgi:hypothetical protein
MCIHPETSFERLPKFPLDEFRQNVYGFKRFTRSPQRGYRTHKEVESFLSKCVTEKLISLGTFDGFQDAKHLRWVANYAPSYSNPLRFVQMNEDLINRMPTYQEEIFSLIVKLNQEYLQTTDKHDLVPQHIHDYLASFIGDGIGDDFMDTLLSMEEEQEVIEILVKNGLST